MTERCPAREEATKEKIRSHLSLAMSAARAIGNIENCDKRTRKREWKGVDMALENIEGITKRIEEAHHTIFNRYTEITMMTVFASDISRYISTISINIDAAKDLVERTNEIRGDKTAIIAELQRIYTDVFDLGINVHRAIAGE